MNVLKFGGTSMGDATKMRAAAEIVVEQEATIVVLSAMSGVTDTLLNISRAAAEAQKDRVDELIYAFRERFEQCATDLLGTNDFSFNTVMSWTDETVQLIKRHATNYEPTYSERKIVAQGELLTSAIFTEYLNSIGLSAEKIYSPNYIRKREDGHIDMEHLTAQMSTIQARRGTIFVTQGFICRDHQGYIDNFGRGGSDYSAALMAAAIDATQLQIWTDIDGMHNNDPRYVEHTRPIPILHYEEAAELAYFGAKILHPDTIEPCKVKSIPVYLKNTMQPQAQGTLISDCEDYSSQFHAVAAKDGITAIRIQSTGMLMAYGFLRRVFEVFEHYSTPIDMITTSEVAVALTIDCCSNLDRIVAELQQFGTIEVESNNSIVCITGHIDRQSHGLVSRILSNIDTMPVKMVSYGASARSVTLLVDTCNKIETLRHLNTALFPCTAAE